MDHELNKIWREFRGEDLPKYAEQIPPLTLHALVMYAVHRQIVGHFLMAFLTNDLRGVLDHADEENIKAIKEINLFIYNRMPAGCHGSKENVKKWIDGPDHPWETSGTTAHAIG